MYRQCQPRRVKDTNISEIENTLCLRSFVNGTEILKIEREHWGASCILRTVNAGVYISSCSVRSQQYMCKTRHAFIYASNFIPLHQSRCCEALIDNIVDVPICVLGALWRGLKVVIYFILAKQIFVHFYLHGDWFYNRYMNKTIKTKYLDNNGSRVKPGFFFAKTGIKCSFIYN